MPDSPRNQRSSHDEVRKQWLIHCLGIDPHFDRDAKIHNLPTSDVLFVYDMGYRAALLQIRREIVNFLENVEIPTSNPTDDELAELRRYINSDFNGGIRQSIKQKIDASFRASEGYSSKEINKSRRQDFERQVESNWWV